MIVGKVISLRNRKITSFGNHEIIHWYYIQESQLEKAHACVLEKRFLFYSISSSYLKKTKYILGGWRYYMDGRGLEVKTVSKLLMEILGRWKKKSKCPETKSSFKERKELFSIFLTACLWQLTSELNKLWCKESLSELVLTIAMLVSSIRGKTGGTR